jgi:peptide/nickel transport system substrate-binding protein
MKLSKVLTSLMMLLAVLVLVMQFGVESASAAPKKGGTVTFVPGKEPTSLVAAATVADPTIIISTKIHDSLVNLDKDGNPRPGLAESWTISQDGKTVTFKLRKGVKWHDGKEFTSDDVAFSIMALKKYSPRGKVALANVNNVDNPDPYTAVVNMTFPTPYLFTTLCGFESPMLPHHVYGDGDLATHPNNINPIGCGPFKLAEWKPGSHLILVAFEDYWDKPKPYLEKIIYKFIADPSACAVALETKEADLMGSGVIPMRDTPRLEKLSYLAADEIGIVGITAGVVRIEFNLNNQYFKNVKVRQAVAHAIDKEFIKNTLLSGYGIVTDSVLSPLLTPFYTNEVTHYPYDLKKAEKLLDEAGFKRGKDGIRFTVTHDPLPIGEANVAIGNYLKPALKKVGIEVNIRSQDMAAYLKRVYTDRDFDFINNGMNTGPDPTLGAQRLYWSKNYIVGVPFSNGSGYNNPEVDRLLEAASREANQQTRIKQWQDIQKLISKDLPDIPLVTAKRVLVYNKRVKNVHISPAAIYDNFADVFVED